MTAATESASVWPEGTRRDSVANAGCLGMLAYCLGASLVWAFAWPWPFLVLGLLAIPAAVSFGRFENLPHLTVDAERLRCEWTRGRVVEIELVEIRDVSIDWMLGRDSALKVRSRDGTTIQCRCNEANRPFLRTLGAHLAFRKGQIPLSTATERWLGWS